MFVTFDKFSLKISNVRTALGSLAFLVTRKLSTYMRAALRLFRYHTEFSECRTSFSWRKLPRKFLLKFYKFIVYILVQLQGKVIYFTFLVFAEYLFGY